MPNQTGQKLRKYNIKHRFSKAKATIPKQKKNSKVGKTSWKARKSNYKTVYQKNWKAEVAFKTCSESKKYHWKDEYHTQMQKDENMRKFFSKIMNKSA